MSYIRCNNNDNQLPHLYPGAPLGPPRHVSDDIAVVDVDVVDVESSSRLLRQLSTEEFRVMYSFLGLVAEPPFHSDGSVPFLSNQGAYNITKKKLLK